MRTRSTSVKGPAGVPVPAGGANVLFDTWLVMRATTGALDTALAPTGLTADEFGVYSVLNAAGTMTPTELARAMFAPATTVSSYVKRFEGRGHLSRERNPLDGRSSVLRLTPAGLAAHRAGSAAFRPVLQAVLRRLGSAEPEVRRALETLRLSLTPADAPST